MHMARAGTAVAETKASVHKKFRTHPLVQGFVVFGYAIFLLPFGIWWFVRSPVRLTAVGLTAGGIMAYRWVGWWGVGGLCVACLLVAVAWYLHGPSAFLSWWRVHWRYLMIYLPSWKKVAAKFTDEAFPDEEIKIKDISGNAYVDVVTIKMLPMQKTEAFVAKSKEIAQTLDATGCRAVQNAKSVHLVDLQLWHDDPLKKLNPEPFPIPAAPADGNWYRWFQTQMKIKIREDGTRVGVDLTRGHWGIFGKTGSGKSSSRLWPFVRMSLPMVQAGCLRYVTSDWKEGLELRAGRPIFEMNGGRFLTTPEETALVLREEVAQMREEARQLGVDVDNAQSADDITRAIGVDYPLGPDHKWTVFIFDELLEAFNPTTDAKVRSDIVGSILTLQRIGRALGRSVVGAAQQAHKDILEQIRNGFTIRDVLALEEEYETRMLFEKGAIDMYGIAPHDLRIPQPGDPDQRGDQGIGWSRATGYPRERGTFVSNLHIWDLRQMLPGAWDMSEPMPTEASESKPKFKVITSQQAEEKRISSLRH